MLGRKERDQLELFVTGSLRQLVPDDHIIARVTARSEQRGSTADPDQSRAVAQPCPAAVPV